MEPSLLRAYLATDYRVDWGTPVSLRVGVPSPELDRRLSAGGHRTWAFVTAVNPGSTPLLPQENAQRMRLLAERIKALGLTAIPGTSVAQDPDSWEPEPSWLILECDEEWGRALGTEFGQRAILCGTVGSVPRLVACSPLAAGQDLSTLAIHAGEHLGGRGRAAITPVWQSVVWAQAETGDDKTVLYPRYSNLPNHDVVHARIAALEGAAEAQLFSSGMAATTAAILGATTPGGRILMQRDVYGGTHALATVDLPAMGRTITFVDMSDATALARAATQDVQAVWVEAMTNPLQRIADHAGIVAFAKSRGLVSMVDSTFAPPVLWRPLSAGYDLSIHSATKFLNGHSDLTAGVVSGRTDLMAKVRGVARRQGGTLDPWNVWMLERGLKTMPIRVQRSCETALALAHFLASQKGVRRAYHPGLPSHPDFDRARTLFGGRAALFAFEMEQGGAAAEACLNALQLVVHGPSLGGVESLAVRPVTTSHRSVPVADREAMGITDGLIRVSVGIERFEDLAADFVQAIQSV